MSTKERHLELVTAAKGHYAADMLVKGTYGEKTGAGKRKVFKGCSVGCLAFGIDGKTNGNRREEIHAFVARHYDYPEWLAYLQDTIFEGLPNGPQGENSKWHVQLAEAIAALPEDHDWQATLHRVHVAILRVSYRTAGTAQEVVEHVINLHERAGRGEKISNEMWSAAESAARSAESAWSAAESAAWSARSAARSAAESAARSAAYVEMRDAILAALPEPVSP